jgi:drug/metabolite transporter (DMT)-like permease
MSSSSPAAQFSPWVVPTALIVLYFSWGTTNLAIRIGVQDMPPFLFGGVRLALAGAIVLAMVAYRTGQWKLSPGDLMRCALSSTLLFVGGNGLLTCSMQYLESGLAAVVIAVSPIWMALMELAVPHGDRLTSRGWYGLLLGFVGILILGWYKIAGGSSFDNQMGFLLASASAVVWSLGTLLSKYLRPRCSVWLAASYQMLLGGTAMIITGAILGEPQRLTAGSFTWSALLAFLYLLIIGSLIGFVIYQFLLTHVSLALAGTYAYVTPIISLVVGAALAHEEVPLAAVLALMLTLVGVYLIKQGMRREAVS